MQSEKPKIVAVVGPTASGKTSLGIALAKKYGGEIVSADSRQVYRGMDIGTGKVTKREARGIPHHLLDIASPHRTFTVAAYQKAGRRAIEKILAKGKIPVIVGGTGLYVDALTHRYAFPAVKPNLELRARLEREPTEKLFLKLQKLDHRRAKNIDQHNKRRLVRALEIIDSTGKPTPGREESLNSASDYDVLKIGVHLATKTLLENIHRRLIKRLRHGMIREVEQLHKKGLSWKRLDDLGLEYRYISRYLRGILTKQQMTTELQKEIQRYAKRQMTWFKRDKEIHWIQSGGETEKLVHNFFKTGSPSSRE